MAYKSEASIQQWEGEDFCPGVSLGNGTGQPQGVGKLTRTLTREDRVLDLTG